MRTLTPAELLAVWESGLQSSPAERAIAFLRTSMDEGADDPGHFPIGGRDARLLSLREQIFGPEINGVVSCARCGESIELRFPVGGLRLPEREVPARLAFDVDEYSAEFRLPNSFDLAAVQNAGSRNGESAPRMLLDRCLSRATRSGEPITAAELPESVVDAIADTMAAADPQAEIEFALECPGCGRQWNELFDIESFLWDELQAWAGRTLLQIHQLASAYGWSEQEILSLSPARRNAYLGLIGEY